MVVTAISGGLSLAVMSLLFDSTKINNQMHRQIDLARDVESFFYALETYVSQTVQVVSCDCASGASPTCRNDALGITSPIGAATKDVFKFVYEDAFDPRMPIPATGCLEPGATIPGSNIVPLGCKKYMKLSYTPPTLEDVGTASVPGKLELTQVLPLVNGAELKIASLGNVTSFGCGMSPNSATVLSNSDFRTRIEVKARQYNFEDVTQGNYESWAPDGRNFNLGLRRSHVGQILFRNLTITGIQFGKMRSYKNCTPDGAPVGAAVMCCSGYADDDNCLAASSCTPNNPGAITPTPLDSMCCSRMRDSTSQACL